MTVAYRYTDKVLSMRKHLLSAQYVIALDVMSLPRFPEADDLLFTPLTGKMTGDTYSISRFGLPVSGVIIHAVKHDE